MIADIVIIAILCAFSVIGYKKGRIYIDYYSRDDLDRISELLELLKQKTLTLKDLSNFNKNNKFNV